MTTSLTLILCLLLLRTIAESILNRLNAIHVTRLKGDVPESLHGISDQKSWDRTTEYTLAKSRFGFFEQWYEAVVLVFVMISN